MGRPRRLQAARRSSPGNQTEAVSAACPSLGLVVRRPVRAREPHGGGGRTVARGLDTAGRQGAGVRRRGACARAAPRFDMRPTPKTACGQDVPAPSIRPPPHPANRDRRDLSATGALQVDVGHTQHTKTDIVVTVVRVVVVAVVRARVTPIVVPGAAAHNARFFF